MGQKVSQGGFDRRRDWAHGQQRKNDVLHGFDVASVVLPSHGFGIEICVVNEPPVVGEARKGIEAMSVDGRTMLGG